MIDLDLALPVDLAPILGSLRATLEEVEDFTFELALDLVSLTLLPVLVSDFPARLLPLLVRDLPRDLVCDLERDFLVDLIPEVVRVIATTPSDLVRDFDLVDLCDLFFFSQSTTLPWRLSSSRCIIYFSSFTNLNLKHRMKVNCSLHVKNGNELKFVCGTKKKL